MTAPRDDVFWYPAEPPHPANSARLDRDLAVDAVVVGGGMAGLTAAQFLRGEGLSVALLEKEFCGAGASGKSSGFITPASELELSELVAHFGVDRGRELWAFAEGGVELIRSNICAFGIDCDYQVQDSLLVAVDDRGEKHVAQEHGARTAAGYPSTHFRKEELPAVLGTTAFGGGVRYPGTFGIDSYRYCRGLRDALAEQGVLFFEDTPVTEVLPREVRAAGHKVSAGHVVLCADRAIPDLSPLHEQIGQIQTFLAISRPLRDDQVRRLFPGEPVMTWDSKLTYNYFRLTGEQRLLVGGANLWHAYVARERHDPVRNLAPLADFIARTFPGLDLSWDRVWPGVVGVSKDFLPVAGADADAPSLRYIGATAGLPWAAALGRHAGRSISAGMAGMAGTAGSEDEFPEFSPYRRAVRGAFANHLLSRRAALALAHAIYVARSL